MEGVGRPGGYSYYKRFWVHELRPEHNYRVKQDCRGLAGEGADVAAAPGSRVKGTLNWAAKRIVQMKKLIFGTLKLLNY
jgi:hypothetical protein